MDQVCTKEVVLKLQEYEQVAKSFSQFFSQDDIGALIDRKADLELVRRIQDNKATRKEVQHVQ